MTNTDTTMRSHGTTTIPLRGTEPHRLVSGRGAWGKTVRPEIVTLCGSMRFLALMLDVAAQETVAGRIVLAPFAVVPVDDQDSTVKRELDELHRRKIDLSDRVIVVSDHTGYYGESTRGEIAYARGRGLPVELVDPTREVERRAALRQHVADCPDCPDCWEWPESRALEPWDLLAMRDRS